MSTQFFKATRVDRARYLRYAGATYKFADFADLYAHDTWVEITDYDLRQHPELQQEIMALINTAYQDIGGHATLRGVQDLLRNDVVFHVEDVDEDPYADAVVVEERSPFGRKTIGIGQDGGKRSKVDVVDKATGLLKRGRHYAEVSGKVANILLNSGVPTVDSPELVKKILLGKEITWLGKHPEGKDGYGWYRRNIRGTDYLKIMVGIPSVS